MQHSKAAAFAIGNTLKTVHNNNGKAQIWFTHSPDDTQFWTCTEPVQNVSSLFEAGPVSNVDLSWQGYQAIKDNANLCSNSDLKIRKSKQRVDLLEKLASALRDANCTPGAGHSGESVDLTIQRSKPRATFCQLKSGRISARGVSVLHALQLVCNTSRQATNSTR